MCDPVDRVSQMVKFCIRSSYDPFAVFSRIISKCLVTVCKIVQRNRGMFEIFFDDGFNPYYLLSVKSFNLFIDNS